MVKKVLKSNILLLGLFETTVLVDPRFAKVFSPLQKWVLKYFLDVDANDRIFF